MRDQYSLTLRIISTIVLSFFCWTFGGIFDIAYAVQDSSQLSALSDQQRKGSSQSSAFSNKQITPPGLPLPQVDGRRAEEKFGKDLVDIGDILKDDKSDHESKKIRIKSKRAEIDADDVEVKKQFKDTEDKIKNLPEVIKQRHRDFVKKYDDNLQTLKTNLDDIDRAKTQQEKDLSQKKTKNFLEKVKPHQKQALDPENLPNRTPELKEYQKIDKKQAQKAELLDPISELFYGMRLDTLILVAANGPLSGILNGSGSGAKLSKMSIPTSEDLSESIEVQLTPEIRAKAQELGNNPVKIYEFVRNSIDYEPYYGSLKGAQQTLSELAGNDFDQASLLIAMLRAANVPARYVYGTVELPLDRIMNWLGGFTNPNAAAQFLATNGIPGTLITEGGVIKYAQFEHVWVEAYVDMLPSMGAVNKQGRHWTPIDSSMKDMVVSQSIDISKDIPFDETAYITSGDDMPPVLSYIYKVKDYYNTNYDYDFTKVFHVAVKNRKEFGVFMGTLPYQVISAQRYSEVPDAKRHKIGLTLAASGIYDTGVVYAIKKTLPEIAGKMLTISFSPATASDQALVNNYGGLLKTPAYLVNVKPEIRLNDTVILAGSAMGLGSALSLTTQLDSPNLSTYIKTTDITHGISYAIGLPALHYSGPQLVGQIDKLRVLQGTLYDSIDAMDARAGELLQNIAIQYFGQLNNTSKSIEGIMHVRLTKMPSIALVSADAAYDSLFGMPVSAPIMKGLGIDAFRVASSPMPIDGDMAKRKEFIKHRGLNSSYLEHKILENLLGVESISAVKALQIAAKSGVPIYTITSGNIGLILSTLTLSDRDKTDIQNVVNAGKEVTVSRDNVTLQDWTGVGYIARDSKTGSGAYMISNDLGGGGTANNIVLRFMTMESFLKHLRLAFFVAGSQLPGDADAQFAFWEATFILGFMLTPLWWGYGYVPVDWSVESKSEFVEAATNQNTWILHYQGHANYKELSGVEYLGLSWKKSKWEEVYPSDIWRDKDADGKPDVDLKIVFLNSCNTGRYGSFAFPFGVTDQIYRADNEARKEVLLGWDESVGIDYAVGFALDFWLGMFLGKTVKDAADETAHKLGPNPGRGKIKFFPDNASSRGTTLVPVP